MKYYYTVYPDGISEIDGELFDILKRYKNWHMVIGEDLFESLDEAKQYLLDYAKAELEFCQQQAINAKAIFDRFLADDFDVKKLERIQ